MAELHKLFSIMITVPVTSAECERSFSKLALIKSKSHTDLEKLFLCSLLWALLGGGIMQEHWLPRV